MVNGGINKQSNSPFKIATGTAIPRTAVNSSHRFVINIVWITTITNIPINWDNPLTKPKKIACEWLIGRSRELLPRRRNETTSKLRRMGRIIHQSCKLPTKVAINTKIRVPKLQVTLTPNATTITITPATWTFKVPVGRGARHSTKLRITARTDNPSHQLHFLFIIRASFVYPASSQVPRPLDQGGPQWQGQSMIIQSQCQGAVLVIHPATFDRAPRQLRG